MKSCHKMFLRLVFFLATICLARDSHIDIVQWRDAGEISLFLARTVVGGLFHPGSMFQPRQDLARKPFPLAMGC